MLVLGKSKRILKFLSSQRRGRKIQSDMIPMDPVEDAAPRRDVEVGGGPVTPNMISMEPPEPEFIIDEKTGKKVPNPKFQG